MFFSRVATWASASHSEDKLREIQKPLTSLAGEMFSREIDGSDLRSVRTCPGWLRHGGKAKGPGRCSKS
ncbi:hypothetical protein BDV23DRAFT_156086 [Aspergillus alliaceus]|uniref:Uncharacterized protein n=1 Tax=Petromyces alliaceus TaxID=209559 RepID=A0A5N7C782_PETAA|nr:hypothetical protein BDV23DRAFT_156086 [Aspergillus alliaceus]